MFQNKNLQTWSLSELEDSTELFLIMVRKAMEVDLASIQKLARSRSCIHCKSKGPRTVDELTIVSFGYMIVEHMETYKRHFPQNYSRLFLGWCSLDTQLFNILRCWKSERKTILNWKIDFLRIILLHLAF